MGNIFRSSLNWGYSESSIEGTKEDEFAPKFDHVTEIDRQQEEHAAMMAELDRQQEEHAARMAELDRQQQEERIKVRTELDRKREEHAARMAEIDRQHAERIKAIEEEYTANLPPPTKFQLWKRQNPIDWKKSELDFTSRKPINCGGEADIYEIEIEGKIRIAKVFRSTCESGTHEIQALRYLNHIHPEIVPQIFGYFTSNEESPTQGRTILILEQLFPFTYSDASADKLLEYVRILADEGLKHTDISPSNILQAADGAPKLIDFSSSEYTKFYSEGVSSEVALARSLLTFKYPQLQKPVAEIRLLLDKLIPDPRLVKICTFNTSCTNLLDAYIDEPEGGVVMHFSIYTWYLAYVLMHNYEVGIEWISQRQLEDPSIDTAWFLVWRNQNSPLMGEFCAHIRSMEIGINDFLNYLQTKIGPDPLFEKAKQIST